MNAIRRWGWREAALDRAAAAAEATSPQDNHVARLLRLDQANDVARYGRHDPLVFFSIAMSVVDVGHRLGLVIGDAVHRVAAEAEPCDRGQAGTPQIVRRGSLDPQLCDQRLQ